MLEVPAEHRPHPDPLRQAGRLGPEAADAPDDQIDLGAGIGGGIEGVDHALVDEGVHLHHDAAAFLGGGLPDQLDGPVPHAQRGGEDLAEVGAAAVAGQVVEEVGQVGAEVGISGEEADVLVEPGRRRVVVAGADMAVAPDPARLGPNHQRRLGVGLQPDEAEDHAPRPVPHGTPDHRGDD